MPRCEKQNKSANVDALNANYDFDVSELDHALLMIGGTFVGTLTFYASDDGTNFVPIFGTPLNSATAVGTATATGKGYRFSTGGLKTLRATMTAYTSGAAAVRGAGMTR